jgi:hypothetical protein
MATQLSFTGEDKTAGGSTVGKKNIVKDGKTLTAPDGWAYFGSDEVGYTLLPHDTDLSAWGAERGLTQETLEALEGQVATAEKAIGTAQQAGTAAQAAARRKAAMSLASYRGAGSGGRGMAAGAEAAQTAGITEANILADTAKNVSQEEADAAAARSEAAVAKTNILEQTKKWKNEAIQAQNDVDAIFAPLYSNKLYTSFQEINDARKALWLKLQAAVSPEAKKVFADAINAINTQSLDFGGWDKWKDHDMSEGG